MCAVAAPARASRDRSFIERRILAVRSDRVQCSDLHPSVISICIAHTPFRAEPSPLAMPGTKLLASDVAKEYQDEVRSCNGHFNGLLSSCRLQIPMPTLKLSLRNSQVPHQITTVAPLHPNIGFPFPLCRARTLLTWSDQPALATTFTVALTHESLLWCLHTIFTYLHTLTHARYPHSSHPFPQTRLLRSLLVCSLRMTLLLHSMLVRSRKRFLDPTSDSVKQRNFDGARRFEIISCGAQRNIDAAHRFATCSIRLTPSSSLVRMDQEGFPRRWPPL